MRDVLHDSDLVTVNYQKVFSYHDFFNSNEMSCLSARHLDIWRHTKKGNAYIMIHWGNIMCVMFVRAVWLRSSRYVQARGSLESLHETTGLGSCSVHSMVSWRRTPTVVWHRTTVTALVPSGIRADGIEMGCSWAARCVR